MNPLYSNDTKLKKMLMKTIYVNVLGKVENILLEYNENVNITNEIYYKLFGCLCEIIKITNNSPIDKSDYLHALYLQNDILDKMSLIIEKNIS
jgi:hypothetical protein